MRSPGPGPHRHGGHVVAFWSYVEPDGELDPRDCRSRASRDPRGARGLRRRAAPICTPEDIDTALSTGSSRPTTSICCASSACGSPAGAWQAVHGHAHLANCLPGPRGTTSRPRVAARGVRPRRARSVGSGDGKTNRRARARGVRRPRRGLFEQWSRSTRRGFRVVHGRTAAPAALGPILAERLAGSVDDPDTSRGAIRGSAEIGVPRFELGTSPTRTERATRLRHTPRTRHRVAGCPLEELAEEWELTLGEPYPPGAAG